MLPALPTGMQSASRSSAELLDELEGRRLLALEPERVDGVDERDRVVVRTARAPAPAPGRSCRAARSRARRASAPGRACRSRSCPRARSPRRAARPAPRRRPRSPRCCRSTRRSPPAAPSRTAAETAHVMPRSLNEPVGLVPSSFSCTSAPTRSDSVGAATSGVEPSPSVTTGSPGGERQAVAVALDQARHGASPNSSSITRIARGRERTKSSPPIRPDRRRRSATRGAGARP